MIESLTSQEFAIDQPVTIESLESQRPAAYAYLELVRTGHITPETLGSIEDSLRNTFSDYQKAADALCEANEKRFQAKNSNPLTIFNELLDKKGIPPLTTEDLSGIEFETVRTGMYLFKVRSDVSQKIRPGAAAFASVGREAGAVQFIAVQVQEGTQYEHSNEQILTENVPHEMHHLIWREYQERGSTKDSEILWSQNKREWHMKQGFETFRDEMIARMVGGANPTGYTHIKLLERSKLEECEAQCPGIQDSLREKTGKFNGLLHDIFDQLIEQSTLKLEDLIPIALQAEDWEDLEKRLMGFQDVLASIPKQKQEVADIGWGENDCGGVLI